MSTSSSQAEPAVPSATASRLEGIGGWLILLAISQVVGIAAVTANMLVGFSSLPTETTSFIPLAMTGAVIIEGSLLLFLIYTAFLFLLEKQAVPQHVHRLVFCRIAPATGHGGMARGHDGR